MKNLRHSKFDLNPNERSFPSIPTDAEAFKKVLLTVDKDRISFVIQAYFRDRTPAAFSTNPMLWQALRNWLSSRISSIGGITVSPWEWGLTGSAIIGFSASPSKYGIPFGEHSDLDLFVVNGELFNAICAEAKRFSVATDNQSRYHAARETLAGQLRRGLLIDTKHIPSVDAYKSSSIIHNEISIIVDKLNVEGYRVKRSHVRAYRDWTALATQLKLNLSQLREDLAASQNKP